MNNNRIVAPLAVRPTIAAEMLGISRRKIDYLLSTKELPCSHLSKRCVVIKVADLEAYLDRCVRA